MAEVRDVLELNRLYFEACPDAFTEEKVTALLEAGPAAFSRQNFSPGHITASGLVLSSVEDEILLVFHKRLKRWIQPGGHIESPDIDLLSAARREVVEETGVRLCNDYDEKLLSIDIHSIPAGNNEPEHLHFDYKFAFRVVDKLPGKREEELALRWCPLKQLEESKNAPSLLKAIRQLEA